jgi:hypothetical protein
MLLIWLAAIMVLSLATARSTSVAAADLGVQGRAGYRPIGGGDPHCS